LHTPAQRLWKAERGPDGLRIVPEPDSTERLAFVGVRACELHAIAIQDRVLLEGAYADPPHRDAMPEEVVVGDAVIAGAAARMARAMPAADEVPQLLRRNFENPRWEEVAGRCLTCGNCTMVCPTCFCTTVEEVSSLDGVESERMRHWDSCFTIDFSYLHGGSVRTSPRSRYRQWMTHKLSTWWDQFGSSGCVGCGRCITWCPVGIDITEEVAAIRGTDTAEAEQGR
jgi:sulfhydrogenase subunit beta (sulfur reductase)